jgi:hypothetical protein
MKLFAEHDGEQHEIEIRVEDLKVFARVGEKKYELEARQVEPNTYLFNLGGRIYECYVAPKNAAGINRVRQGTKTFDLKLSDPNVCAAHRILAARRKELHKSSRKCPAKSSALLLKSDRKLKPAIRLLSSKR